MTVVCCGPPQKLFSAEIKSLSLRVFFSSALLTLANTETYKENFFVTPSPTTPPEWGKNICLMLLLSRISLDWHRLVLQYSQGPPFVPRSHARTDYTPVNDLCFKLIFHWRLENVPY